MTTAIQNSVLRFITAGSVDDGKSTLIGRLLYDSKALLVDHIEQISNDKTGSNNGTLDFAQLTDGLIAEREQGITIDVAYRYFTSSKRKFIIADTPGHEQYTRNMVTGASTADAAIILIDVTRLDFTVEPLQLLAQTKRHSALLKLLNCQHIVVAVNKLDLLEYSEDTFNKVVVAYQLLADYLAIKNVIYIPISALNGDNLVDKSINMPWYKGQPILATLEQLDLTKKQSSDDSYFPVQFVLRQDGSKADDFRGYQGRLEQGSLSVGQQIRLANSTKSSSIAAIYTPNGQVQTARTGEVLTITLEDDIDISRGDVLISSHSKIIPTNQLTAALCWFDEHKLNPARKYLLKHNTKTVVAKIKSIDYLWDVHTLSSTQTSDSLQLNDIGRVQLSLQQHLTVTTYQENQQAGAFILIDEITNNTVAAGMIVATNELSNWVI